MKNWRLSQIISNVQRLIMNFIFLSNIIPEDPRRRDRLPTPVFLPGESPWREEPGRLQSMGSRRVRHDWVARHKRASQEALVVKNVPAMRETWVQSLGWKIPWRREWLPVPIFLPGEFHEQRNLAGYSP